MPRTDNFTTAQRFCVMCQNPIPKDKKWDAITCSPECKKARKDYGRSREDQRMCVYCRRPATPEERARFSRWRQWERAGQNDEKSAATLLRENVRLKHKLAELEVNHAEVQS